MPGHYGKKPAAKKKAASTAKTAAKLKAKNPRMPQPVASAIAKNMSNMSAKNMSKRKK